MSHQAHGGAKPNNAVLGREPLFGRFSSAGHILNRIDRSTAFKSLVSAPIEM